MTNCELCGSKPSKYQAEIEGTMMLVCEDCSRFGKIKGKSAVKIIVEDAKKIVTLKEPEYVFLPGFGSAVKNAREKLGLKQDEMAKKLNERESLLHQIESEHIKPSIGLAQKLERVLHIKIVEEIKDSETDKVPKAQSKAREGFTLGDMIKHR